MTTGYKSFALFDQCTSSSFRTVSKTLNETRCQPGATPVKTLQEASRREAEKVIEHTDAKIEAILKEHSFSPEGKAIEEGFKISLNSASVLSPLEIEPAIKEYASENKVSTEKLMSNCIDYENTCETVEVAIDDIGVKKQKKGEELKQSSLKRIHNTVVYIEYCGGAYRYCTDSLDKALRFTLAFLISNNLLDKRLRFFTDGERRLKNQIFEFFSWHEDISLILDWQHASKKAYDLLSMATYKKHKDEILNITRSLLWQGRTEELIAYIEGLDKGKIRNAAIMNQISGYYKRNLEHIPCYCVRKKLGLSNSSNRVEKANDMLIANRQKKKGAAWTPKGSLSLGTLTAVCKNGQKENWLKNGTIEFKLLSQKTEKRCA